jgi:hypothetical protein
VGRRPYYEPIELRAVADDGTVVTRRFVTYETLPATAANLALLSLGKQHPCATVIQDVTVEGYGPDSAKLKIGLAIAERPRKQSSFCAA